MRSKLDLVRELWLYLQVSFSITNAGPFKTSGPETSASIAGESHVKRTAMIYIVTGMHRSGTSMVAGLLHHSGIGMGSRFRLPLPENPKGFYEEELFRSLNDSLLEEVGYRVKDWNPQFNGACGSPVSHSTAVSLITTFAQTSDNWGWKDPRTCLTLVFWLSVIETADLLGSTKIIVVKRQTHAISRSLRKRGNTSSLSQGTRLARMYNAHLARGLSEYSDRIDVLYVRYERLIRGLDIDRLELFCGIRIDQSFVDPSLDHSLLSANDRFHENSQA